MKKSLHDRQKMPIFDRLAAFAFWAVQDRKNMAHNGATTRFLRKVVSGYPWNCTEYSQLGAIGHYL
jgi:hypothetical protein